MSAARTGDRRRAGAMIVILVLTAASIAYARQVDWQAVLAVIERAALGGLVLAFAFHALSLLSRAGVWWILLRAFGTPAFGTIARITVVGAALNSLTVANGGEAGRIVLASRSSGIRAPAVLATIVLDHVIRSVGLVALVLVIASFTPLPLPLPHRQVALGVLAAIVVVAMVVCQRGRRADGGDRPRKSTRRARPRLVRLARVFARRSIAAARCGVTAGRLGLMTPFVLVYWLCELASYHLVALAAHLPLSITGTLLALIAVNLGFVLRATPGNVGVFELAYAATATAQGVSPGAALAVGMLIHLVQDVPTIVLAVVLGRPFARSHGGSIQ